MDKTNNIDDLVDDEADDIVSDDDHVSGTLSKIPNRPHPMVSKLQELDFSLLPEHFFSIVYGARRTGKTHSVSVLLERIKDRFDFAYLFSNTAHLHKGEKGHLDFDMIVDDAKFEGFDEEALKRIIERQIKVKHFNNTAKASEKKPNNTLIIFDDFVHEKAVRYSKTFTELPVLGRHYELSVICLTQGYSQVASGGLNKATRQNADLVMTFLPRSIVDQENISNWYLTKDKVENVWFLRSVCQNEHTLLGINLTEPHLTEYEDYCTIYKAPEKVPKYELGKVQWDLEREERKRHKNALMHANMQSRLYPIGSEYHDRMEKVKNTPQGEKRKGGLYNAFVNV